MKHDNDGGSALLGQFDKRSEHPADVVIAVGVDALADERDERIQRHQPDLVLLDLLAEDAQAVWQRERVREDTDKLEIGPGGLESWPHHRG